MPVREPDWGRAAVRPERGNTIAVIRKSDLASRRDRRRPGAESRSLSVTVVRPLRRREPAHHGPEHHRISRRTEWLGHPPHWRPSQVPTERPPRPAIDTTPPPPLAMSDRRLETRTALRCLPMPARPVPSPGQGAYGPFRLQNRTDRRPVRRPCHAPIDGPHAGDSRKSGLSIHRTSPVR